ncbi:MAG: grasp-with-spasm system A modified peptide [Chryseobacterium sp.]|uniref:grasp-with-spasm system A modified peptide n=1 Tax=Chryseobacterium sp. TaxID=1871047 RepID=UPI00281E5C77|nr:grasp-with-spasm system A modified peptide [Chryseobacterium sp.]MDR2237551.1 grasp-with-spasm system A modified peptide [Chryseobacterium sp.]
MKKLNGMKKNFSSFENKKLKHSHKVMGGDPTNNTVTKPTCDPFNCKDIEYITDGVHNGIESLNADC